MSSVEPARHALYSRLEDVLGPEHADTLMTFLPEHQSEQIATRGDLGELTASLDVRFDRIEERFDRIEERFDRMEERFDRMEARMDRMEDRMDRMQRFYVGATVGSMTALTAIFSFVVSILN
ncbi:MAG: hypothetical protein WA726_10695 [Acidimicrobiia bacterium]